MTDKGKYLPISIRVCVLSCFNHVRLFVTLRTVAHQVSLSMGFSRHEYCSGLPCPPPGDLPDSRIEPVSLMSPALAGGFFTTSATWETHISSLSVVNGLAEWSVRDTERTGLED